MITSILIFVFGLCIGSFLNCFIYRLENNKTVSGRSFCPNCKHTLCWLDLIPLFSFIFLKGKCRYCKKAIFFQYPLVELATGLVFLLIFNFQFSIFKQFSIIQLLNFQTIFYFFYLITISSVLIIIFVYDLKTMYIPSSLVYLAIGVVLLYKVYGAIAGHSFYALSYSFLSGLFFALFLFIFWAVSKGKWMGFGDVELAFLVGFFLGWPLVIAGFFTAFTAGGIIAMLLIILGKKNMQSKLPLGPFLVFGSFIALFFGDIIIKSLFFV